MAIGRRLQLDYWFLAAMACFLLLVCPAFMVFAPWTSVVTLTEANELYPGQVDPNWRAAAVYHGQPHEWPLGTIGENPVGFAGCAAVLALGVSGFIYCAYRSSRFQRQKLRPQHRLKLNPPQSLDAAMLIAQFDDGWSPARS